MNDLTFAAPQWIHLLWAVAACVALLAWLERRGQGDLGRFVAAGLQPRLVQRTTPLRRTLRLAFLGLTGVFLTLALMRPQWGAQFVSTPRVGAQIMVCLDVSRSMLAEDVAPNRLERAKADLRDLLAYLQGDQVGLIAFAGRATVLSPLTPDFSFLRLVLDAAGPDSVTRGGTRLEEPIRKALAGFQDTGGEGEVSRSILLITDGEDHDSFPLEAAKTAAERGVRIIAIGFGDEAGSTIEITDPTTGARTRLRDGGGNPVQSRLDGDLLREMALVTGGAYIPAGTGAVDLESIYRSHLADLTRGRLDGGGYRVRNDAFQWPLLFALVCLIAAVAAAAVAAPGSAARRAPRALAMAAGLTAAILGGLLRPAEVTAQARHGPSLAEAPPSLVAPGAGEGATGDTAGGQATEAPPEAGSESRPEPDAKDPRATYNQGVADLHLGALDAAAQRFEAARAGAGTDGEVRFRATYDLGWVEVKRADAALEKDPQAALAALERAADWFREAVGLRPEHAASRQNLELVLRRALVLADQLAKREGQDVAGRLDQLIEAERAFLGELGQGVDLAALAQDPAAVEASRRVLRTFATHQLGLLTQAERLSEAAGVEREALQAKPEQEKTAADAVRTNQLGALLEHLHQARERMGQARGQMRRLEAERAYRRVADALTALKRARDQLQNPVARLDALLADGADLLRRTGQKLAVAAVPQGRAPAWLTADYLREAQAALEARIGELHEGLAAGLAQSGDDARQAGSTDTAKVLAEEQFRHRLEAATPLIGEARGAFRKALDELAAGRLNEALDAQRLGLGKLGAAREHFLDLERLVELLYQDEVQVAAALAPVPQTGTGHALPDQDPDAAAPTATAVPPASPVPAPAQAADRTAEAAGRGTAADASPATGSTEPAPPPYTESPLGAVAEPTASPLAAPSNPPAASPATGDPAGGAASPEHTALRAEYLPLALELETGNRERLRRVSNAIMDRLTAALEAADRVQQDQVAGAPGAANASGPAPSAAPPAPGARDSGAEPEASLDPKAVEAEQRLMEQADALRVATEKAMQQAVTDLQQAAALAAGDPALPAAIERSRRSVDRTLEQIAALRRLFFSVIDHLRETLRQQIDLGDRTEEARVLADTESAEEMARRRGPLGSDQAGLAERAAGIGDVLRQQAEQIEAQGPAAQEGAAAAAPPAQEAKERLGRALDLVGSARDHMEQAADGLGVEPPPFDAIRDRQDQAVQALTEALAVLQPPPASDEHQKNDEQDLEQEQQGENGSAPEEAPQGAQQQSAQRRPSDQDQLLQGVRDREAQRREEKAKQQRRGYEPVEKDW